MSQKRNHKARLTTEQQKLPATFSHVRVVEENVYELQRKICLPQIYSYNILYIYIYSYIIYS